MMLTMLPEGCSLALSGIWPGSSFRGGVGSLVRRIEVWSFSATFVCIAEGAALVVGVLKGLITQVRMEAGCS